MNYSVLLIGLGRIGMLYDVGLDETDYVYSHARAFSLHPGFTIGAAVESSPVLREKFSLNYDADVFEDLTKVPESFTPDVVVVATPTITHFAIIEEVLKRHRPKAILCEKPLAYSSSQAEAVVQKCRENGVQLFVNYIRRADPGIMKIKTLLDSGEIVFPIKAIVWYSKGLLHNGSHFVDLLTFWMGPAVSSKIILSGRESVGGDAEPDFLLQFKAGSAIFSAANEDNFSHYTIEFVAKNGRLRYEQDGKIIWQQEAPHPILENYRQLQASSTVIENDARRYQYHVADQLINALKGNAHTLCAGNVEVKNIELLESILIKRQEN